MLERRVSLLCLLLGFFIYLETSAYALGGLANKISIAKGNPDHRVWSQLRADGTAKRRVPDEAGEVGRMRTPLPLATPTTSPMIVTTTSAACPTTTGLALVLGRRALINNNPLVTISSLSSALASATASALSMSQEFALSLEELQSSAEFLAASASSALLAASSAVSAAEASAARAISAAQESAASSVRQALAQATPMSMSITGPLAGSTTTLTQSQLELEAAEGAAMSVTRAAVATVVSIVVAAVFSILGFYLFIRYRRARRKRQEEEASSEPRVEKRDENPAEHPEPPHHHRQQQEVDHELSATEALARAVVSYIEKEQMPSPSEALPSPSGSQHGRKIGFAVGGEVDDPLWVQQHPPPAHPPPPTPVRCAHRENLETIRRTPSGRTPTRRRESEQSIYADIITHPLEAVPTNNTSLSRCSVEGGGDHRQPEHEERRDSNWPLPKGGWL